jgi:hypothetical protein
MRDTMAHAAGGVQQHVESDQATMCRPVADATGPRGRVVEGEEASATLMAGRLVGDPIEWEASR